MKNVGILILVFVIFMACEEEAVLEQTSTKPVVVVDAIVTSEFVNQEVFVYQSSGKLNEMPIPIGSAKVRLSDGVNEINFTPSAIEGRYVSEPFAAVTDKTYALVIEYNGETDTALAVMEPITPFKNDTVYKQGELFQFVYRGSDMPSMTEVFYDWSVVPGYCQAYGSCFAKSLHYTLNNIDIVEEFGPKQQEILFPQGTSIVRTKYSLSLAHQDFLRSLLIETQWRGGLFDVEQANVPTNFSNATKGWFAVCMVLRDSTVVK